MNTNLPSDRHVTSHHRPCMSLIGPSLVQAKKLAKSIAKAEKKEKKKKGAQAAPPVLILRGCCGTNRADQRQPSRGVQQRQPSACRTARQ